MRLIDETEYQERLAKIPMEERTFRKAVEVAEDMPTLDDLVVHCRDCAVPHNKWTGCPKLGGLVTPPDFYCAMGERKKDEMS